MKPGKELDAFIAEKIFHMDMTVIVHHPRPMSLDPGSVNYVDPWIKRPEIDNYSTDIAAAWSVAELLMRTGFRLIIQNECLPKEESFLAAFGEHVAKGQSAPHAICLAAMKAVGVL